MAENLFDLTGKVALVTGGNAGIGLALADALARAGSTVAIWGRRPDANAAALALLQSRGVAVMADAIDVADEAAVVRGVAAVLERFGRIDTVVASAGMASRTPFARMDAAAYHRLLDVNLHGAVFALREVAAHMIARAETGDAGGSMILCGSGAIFQGVPTMAPYAIAKGALNSLAKTLAAELGPHGVRCNVIAPGFIVTDMTMGDPELGRSLVDAVSARTPLGRVGDPADLAGAAVYLASDLSRHHSGDTLVIDGGKLAAN